MPPLEVELRPVTLPTGERASRDRHFLEGTFVVPGSWEDMKSRPKFNASSTEVLLAMESRLDSYDVWHTFPKTFGKTCEFRLEFVGIGRTREIRGPRWRIITEIVLSFFRTAAKKFPQAIIGRNGGLTFHCHWISESPRGIVRPMEISTKQLATALKKEFGDTIDLSKVDINAVARRLINVADLTNEAGTSSPSPNDGTQPSLASRTDHDSRFGEIPKIKTVNWALSLFDRKVLALDDFNRALSLVAGTPIGDDLKLAQKFATSVRRAAAMIEADLIFEGKRCAIYAVGRKNRDTPRFDILGREPGVLNTNSTVFPSLRAKFCQRT